MVSSAKRRYAQVLIGLVAMLAAMIVGVWVMRSSPTSDAAASPREASTDFVADSESVALMQPEADAAQVSELDRSPIPIATESRDSVPFESAVHIAFTVSRPDGTDAPDAVVVLAQFATAVRGAAPAWTITRGYPGRRGGFHYAPPSEGELFALRAFASTGTETSGIEEMTPPFPEQMTLQLEPAAHLIVHVSDETGAPVPEFCIIASAQQIELFSQPRAVAPESGSRRGPSSSATIARVLADGPRWPLRESLAQRVTNERGLADFGELRTGTWRVRLASDPEADTSVSDARLVSGETTELQLRLGATSDTLAVDGVVLDEQGHPLANRCLFAWIDENSTASVTSDALGVFHKWAAVGERVTVEPRLEHPLERFDPPLWEGARGTQGIVFRRKSAGEWVDATVRVVDRSTRTPISAVELEYVIRQRSLTYGPSRTFDGELHAALPVADALQMVVTAPGFGKFTFQSTALRDQAAAGGVFEIELERRAVPKPDRFRGNFEGGDSLGGTIERLNAGGH